MQAALQNTNFNETQVRRGNLGLALASLGTCRGGVVGARESRVHGACAMAGSWRRLGRRREGARAEERQCCACGARWPLGA
jgi:hypothetical protein